MAELAQPDRGAVAVARNSEIIEFLVGKVSAGGNLGHAAMYCVKCVGLAEEVGRNLG